VRVTSVKNDLVVLADCCGYSEGCQRTVCDYPGH